MQMVHKEFFQEFAMPVIDIAWFFEQPGKSKNVQQHLIIHKISSGMLILLRALF